MHHQHADRVGGHRQRRQATVAVDRRRPAARPRRSRTATGRRTRPPRRRTGGRRPAPAAGCRARRRPRRPGRTAASPGRARRPAPAPARWWRRRRPRTARVSARWRQQAGHQHLAAAGDDARRVVPVGARAPVLDLVHACARARPGSARPASPRPGSTSRRACRSVAARAVPSVIAEKLQSSTGITRNSSQRPRSDGAHAGRRYQRPRVAQGSSDRRSYHDPHDRGTTDRGAARAPSAEVEAWRLHVLLQAGYPLKVAERIARRDADLHRAVEMLEHGLRAARGRADPDLTGAPPAPAAILRA